MEKKSTSSSVKSSYMERYVDDEYNQIKEFYEKNKHKPLQDWLELDHMFKLTGKQGKVGLLQSKEDESVKYVMKVSQYINYLIQHEYTIFQSINNVALFCPHFCRGIGILKCKVNPKDSDLFQIESKYPITKEVLLMEYIPNAKKFYNYVKNEKITENIIFSSIKQVLSAIKIAQTHAKFTHYDLHSNNVIMKKCNKNTSILYVIDEKTQILVPTFGYCPMIIDYGFSYADSMKGQPLWPSMGHTNVGFMSNMYDEISDYKLFLITMAQELYSYRKTKKAKRFKKIVEYIYSNLSVDWESGWDTHDEHSASDIVTELIGKISKNSRLFKKYDHYCMDLLQALIITPIEYQNFEKINDSFGLFLQEFIKIENEIGDDFYNLFVLKNIIEIAIECRPSYVVKQTQQRAISMFKIKIGECIDSISKYCSLKDVNYDKMLCGLLYFGRSSEGVLYDVIKEIMEKKRQEYKTMPVQNSTSILKMIDETIQLEYVYSRESEIIVVDSITKTLSGIELTDEMIEMINKVEPFERGTILYKEICG